MSELIKPYEVSVWDDVLVDRKVWKPQKETIDQIEYIDRWDNIGSNPPSTSTKRIYEKDLSSSKFLIDEDHPINFNIKTRLKFVGHILSPVAGAGHFTRFLPISWDVAITESGIYEQQFSAELVKHLTSVSITVVVTLTENNQLICDITTKFIDWGKETPPIQNGNIYVKNEVPYFAQVKYTPCVETDASYYKEHKLAVIGSNTMTGYNKIYNIVFHKNKNGEKTLTFNIKNKYYDPALETEVTNPFCDYLINERKVKLYYDDQWYDFIIKEVEESDEENEWTYTAQDAFVLELSKNGYGVTLDAELNNNQGTAAELAIRTLQDTNWEVVNIDVPPPTIHEALYEAQVMNRFTAKRMDTDEDEVFEPGQNIYVFYSYIQNQDGKFVEFIKTKNEEDYNIDHNSIIDELNYRLDFDTTITLDKEIKKDGVTLIQCGNVYREHQAYRLIYKQLSTYDSVMERNVDQFQTGDTIINHYVDTKYTTSNLISSFITNGNNFNVYENGTLYGWSKYSGTRLSDLDLVTKPRIEANVSLVDPSKLQQLQGFLEVNFKGNGDPLNSSEYTIFNSGFTDNANMIGDVAKGDEFILRVRAGMSPEKMESNTKLLNLDQYRHIEAVVAFYNRTECEQDKQTFYTKQLKPSQILLHFKGSMTDHILNDYMTDGIFANFNEYNNPTQYLIGGVIQEPSTKYVYKEANNDTEYVWDTDNKQYIKKTPDGPGAPAVDFLDSYYYTAKASRSITAEEIRKSDIGVFLYTPSNASGTWYYLQDVQLTRLYKDKNGKILLTGNIPEAIAQNSDYYYLAPKDTTVNKNTIKLYRTLGEIAEAIGVSEESIKPIYNRGTIAFMDNDGLLLKVHKLTAKRMLEQFHVLGYSLEKVLSIDASKSNCFNILQSIAEAFECWIELDVLHNEDGSLWLDEDGIPYKQVLLRRYSGRDNFAGFKYGINLKSIKRTVDSNEIVTKLFVEDSQCDYVDSGVVSISNALSNLSGESYILNFDYLLNKGLIKDRKQCEADLLTFYTEIGEKNRTLKFKQAEYNQLSMALSKMEANRNVYLNLINSAQEKYNEGIEKFSKDAPQPYSVYVESGLPSTLEKIDSILEDIGIIYSNAAVINSYQGLSQNTQQEYLKLKKKLEGISEQFVTITLLPAGDIANSNVLHVEVENYDTSLGCNCYTTDDKFISRGSTNINEKGFDIDTTQSQVKITDIECDSNYYVCNQDGYPITDLQVELNGIYKLRLIPKEEVKGLKQEIDELLEDKKAYIKDFTNKYSRFILEGTWSSNEYISDDLYYLDAMQTSRVSAFPQVTYEIGLIDVAGLDEYHGYTFDTGEKTYVEDTEFFGWTYKDVDGAQVKTPAREEVIISETDWHLDNPTENSIVVQNYKSNFEDLFQRIQATVQTVQYNEQAYPKITSMLSQDGLLNEQLLIQSLIAISGKPYTLTSDGSVVINGDKILIRDLITKSNCVSISSAGIQISSDGQQTWSTVINGQGINIDNVFSTKINTEKITIGNQNSPSFKWDSEGLDAYKILTREESEDPQYDLGTYVRFDQYGLYGIQNNASFVPTGISDIKENADFGLTWDGFFIKNTHAGGGKVEISSERDIEVYEGGDDENSRVHIGYLGEEDGKHIYGIELKNKNGDKTFFTDNDGNLTMSGTIQSANYSATGLTGWQINQNGDAVFNNITARGAIKTAVFEYAEIQAVGGVFLFRPSSTIRSARVADNNIDLILEVEKPALFVPKQGEDYSWCKISNYTADGSEPTPDVQDILNTNGLTHVYKISNVNLSNKEVTLTKGADIISAIIKQGQTVDEILAGFEGGALVDVGREDGTSNYGIGINSSDNTVNLPRRAISLFETNIHPNDTVKVSYNMQGVLGTLPELPYKSLTELNPKVAKLYDDYLKDTQGIYTDNMYIGDADQYVAFYTDKDDNNEKKLKIRANEIDFLTNGKYSSLNNILSVSNEGLLLSDVASGWKIQLTSNRIAFLDKDNLTASAFTNNQMQLGYNNNSHIIISSQDGILIKNWIDYSSDPRYSDKRLITMVGIANEVRSDITEEELWSTQISVQSDHSYKVERRPIEHEGETFYYDVTVEYVTITYSGDIEDYIDTYTRKQFDDTLITYYPIILHITIPKQKIDPYINSINDQTIFVEINGDAYQNDSTFIGTRPIKWYARELISDNNYYHFYIPAGTWLMSEQGEAMADPLYPDEIPAFDDNDIIRIYVTTRKTSGAEINLDISDNIGQALLKNLQQLNWTNSYSNNQLKIKNTLQYITDIFNHNIPIQRTSGDIGIRCKRAGTDKNAVGDVGFIVGSGGINHGVWSYTLSKWLIYGNRSDVFVNNIKMTRIEETPSKIGDYWAGGRIRFIRIGNIVQVTGSPEINKLYAKTIVAEMKNDFLKPVSTTYFQINGTNEYGIINTDGTIQFNATNTGAKYFSVVFVAAR